METDDRTLERHKKVRNSQPGKWERWLTRKENVVYFMVSSEDSLGVVLMNSKWNHSCACVFSSRHVFKHGMGGELIGFFKFNFY